MTGLWQVVTPHADTNLITNPAFRYDNTGYKAYGTATLSHIGSSHIRRGVGGLQVIQSGGTKAGVFYEVTVNDVGWLAWSVDLYTQAGVRYELWITDSSGSITLNTVSSFAGAGRWELTRPEATYQVTSAPVTLRLYLVQYTLGSFYTGGWMLIQQTTGAVAVTGSTYIDGDQPGCYWNGVAHASTSTRDAASRDGGVLNNLDAYSMAVSQFTGGGEPPVENILLRYGLQDGSYYQRTKNLHRPLTIVGTINTGTQQAGASLATLHSNRKALIDALDVDQLDVQQGVWLRYLGGGVRSVLIKALYDAGLEMNYSEKGGFTETMGIRFQAPSPYWVEEGNTSDLMGAVSQNLTDNYLLRRSTAGVWSTLGSGVNNYITTIAVGPDGMIYVGGLFTSVYSSAGSPTTAQRIAKYDPVHNTWATVGSGVSAQVNCLKFDANGYLYVGGNFATAYQTDGTPLTVNRLAMWDGTNWNTVGSGVSGGLPYIDAIDCPSDGNVYVGGTFTTAGSTAAAYVAYWDGAAWHAMGSGMNNIVYSIKYPYFGGAFTTANGVTVNRVTRWTGATFVSLAGGMDDTVRALEVTQDGTLYATGDFTTAGGLTVSYAAYWNWAAWQQVGAGLSGAGYAIAKDPKGNLWIGASDSVYSYNGSVLTAIDAYFPTTPAVRALAWSNIAGLFIGCAASMVVTTSYGLTVTYYGDAPTGPQLVLYRSATSGIAYAHVVGVTNETTGKRLTLNYYMKDGETVTIDFNTKTVVSSYLGNIINICGLTPDSNFANFRLMPGANNMTVFVVVTGTTTVTASWQRKNTFKSMDAGATTP